MAPPSVRGTGCVSTWTFVGLLVVCLFQVVRGASSSATSDAPATPMTCVSFRATENCSPYGSRKPQGDIRCDHVVPSHVAGYCECDFGRTVRLVGCGHANFTCLRECLLTQSDTCSIDPDTGSVSCQTKQPMMSELQRQMQQLHKQQMKMQSEIKRLRYTNSQLMASLHATRTRQKIDAVMECSALTERVLGAILPVVESLNNSGNVYTEKLHNLQSVYQDLQSYVQKNSAIAQSHLMRFLAEATLYQFEPEALTRLVLDAGVSLHASDESSTNAADSYKPWTDAWRIVDIKGKEHWVPRSKLDKIVSSEQLVGIGHQVLNGLKVKLEAEDEKDQTSQAKQSIDEALRIVEWVRDHIGLGNKNPARSTTRNPYQGSSQVVVSVSPRYSDSDQICLDTSMGYFSFDYTLDYMNLLNRRSLQHVESTRLEIAERGSSTPPQVLSSQTWLRPRGIAHHKYVGLGKHWVFDGTEWVLQPRTSTLYESGNLPNSWMSYEDDLNFARQEAVRNAFHHAWSSYKSFAYGDDELQPLTKNGTQTLCNMSLTLVDSLDTLFLMGYFEEFELACNYLRENFSVTSDINTNLFETTIRVIGGLLSAYDLSQKEVLLDLTITLANRIIETGAFSTASGLPMGTLNLRNLTSFNPKWVNGASSLSEVATIQLEFHRLSELSGNTTYRELADNVVKILYNKRGKYGLWPIYVDPDTAEFYKKAPVTLGARGDSAYEYLLKLALLHKKKSEVYAKGKPEANVKERPSHAIHLFTNSTGAQYSELDLVTGAEPTFTDVSQLRYFLDCVQGRDPLCGSQTGDIFSLVRHQYHISLHGILTKLLSYSFPNGLAYIGELVPSTENRTAGEKNGSTVYYQLPKMDHLVCFAPGMLALGVQQGFSVNGSLFALWSHLRWQESSGHDGSLHLARLGKALSSDEQEQLRQLTWDAKALFEDGEGSVFSNISSLREGKERILDVASLLMRSCYELYNKTATGLAPEIATFRQSNKTTSTMVTEEVDLLSGSCSSLNHNVSTTEDQGLDDIIVHQDAKHSLLRPETVESLFVLWRVTHDPVYREWGWNVFQSIQQHAFLDSGYSALKSTLHVNKDAREVAMSLRKWHQRRIQEIGKCNAGCCPPRQNISASICYRSNRFLSAKREFVMQESSNLMNKMESFLLAETFKYLYLLFSDDESVPLDEWVFNTEGHPLRVSR
eukprot:gb/GECG01006114.1/.p1 GENE.gb/GECG01006114.1/~~gb/GECG01006114.1/.p1  ORF type:complete len:1193 (+),score=115.25 gb/GECG01006114.1/:1-3579(+)